MTDTTSKAELILTRPIINGSGAAESQNCSVELLGLAMYGDYRHGYSLPCLDAAAQAAVVAVNDSTSREVKQTRRWRLLIARLALCHGHSNDRLNRRMALWCARSVEHLSDDPRVKACNDVYERWLAGEASDDELATAAEAAWAAGAVTAAEEATVAAGAVTAATTGATWAARAATAGAARATAEAAVDKDEALLTWLDDYLTAWHKTAVDEGEAIPAQADAEYETFLAELDDVLNDGE